jgi:RecA/RadA recombinase
LAKEKVKPISTSLRDRLLKESTIDGTSLLTESKFYTEKDMIPTKYPMVNVALSGRIDGGLIPGVTQLAGPSKHFKSMFALLMGAAYLEQYPEAVMIFYNSEFGTPISYFNYFGIDETRVIVKPLINIEQLKFDAVTTLEGIARGEKVVIIIDSIGNLASLKELEDAKAQKSVAEVGNRAKALKSLFRMITPYLSLKDIPCVVVNHSYKTMEMFSKDVVSGGTGSYYSSETIWLIGRQQEKEDKEVVGYNYIINVEKSRYVKEKSKIPITVTFDAGIQKYSGMLELALEANMLVKQGHSYRFVDQQTGVILEDKKVTNADVAKDEFWENLLSTTNFAEWIRKRYSLGTMEV